jgi:hypothetical protein
MDKAQWDALCAAVRDEMAEYVCPFVTPISQSDDLLRGVAWGTGNYLSLRGVPCLLTNEHVVADAVGSHLAHLPGPTDDYVLCNTPIFTDRWPVDAAVTRLQQNPAGPQRDMISVAHFDREFSPAESELLFWLGFPGSTAFRGEPLTKQNIHYSWFGELQYPGIPVLTQLFPAPIPALEGYDATKHVVLHYPAKATRFPGEELDTLNPKGMSGSFLWDTKFVARTAAGKKWSVEDARICGLVWAAYDKPEVVVGTRIECVLPMLIQFFREECAYFHWIARGRPLGDDLGDWRWAEEQIIDFQSLC